MKRSIVHHWMQLSMDRAAGCTLTRRMPARSAGGGIGGDAQCGCSPSKTATSPESAARSSALNGPRSEEHTSELQSLMRISYAVFCLKKKTKNNSNTYKRHT